MKSLYGIPFAKKVPIRVIKNGDYFRFHEHGKLYVKNFYEHTLRMFSVSPYYDMNRETFVRTDRLVFRV